MAHRALKRVLQGASVLTAACMGIIAIPAFADTFGSGTYGSCEYSTGCDDLTLTSSGAVAVDVTPSGAGACTVHNDVVTVESAASSGFTLTVASMNATSSLVSGADTIPTAAATQASPAALSANTWGYRVDGVGGFGSGPTSDASNVPMSSQTFAGMPTNAQTAATIAATAVSASPPVVTDVWYGLCADTGTLPGEYTGQVLYTAIVN